MSSAHRSLRELAFLYGVQAAYWDTMGRRREAPIESLIAVLRCLGAPVSSVRDAQPALRERRQALWRRPLEPVTVAWGGGPLEAKLRLPYDWEEMELSGYLATEAGDKTPLRWSLGQVPFEGLVEVEGARYGVKRLRLAGGLPYGYHSLVLELPSGTANTLIISAPRRAYVSPCDAARRWGVFMPLYALRTSSSCWGGGDFADLEALLDWTGRMGGAVVGTLPLLPTFLDELFEPSPYAPVSRLFWNEFYVDPRAAPELDNCPKAVALLQSSALEEEAADLRRLPLIDYRRQMALKRGVLEELSECCLPERAEQLRHFIRANPNVGDYARFRATCEERGTSWRSWPEPFRQGHIGEGDCRQDALRYHLYVQWLAFRQMESLSQAGHAKGVALCLDLPLGCHRDGYDTWRWQNEFVMDASVGAPPDSLSARGQDWGFPPLHPGRMQEQGYDYYIGCLRHHLRYADVLRIDHVLSLHRLFWIPKGASPGQGVYVRYPAEELYAIVALESHRHRTAIVGEDLGTVPREVRRSMARHGLRRMYVVPFELSPDHAQALSMPRRDAVASLNTHDMPPFAAFWEGLDIHTRREMGLLTASAGRREWRYRRALRDALSRFLQRAGLLPDGPPRTEAVLQAVLLWLSKTPVPLVLVNLEDLLGHRQSQNIPGTVDEHPNWRRKARCTLEELDDMPGVVGILHRIDDARKEGKGERASKKA